MAKCGLAPPEIAKFGDLVIADRARNQIRDVDEGGTAQIALDNEVGLVSHGAPPSPAMSR